MGPRLTLQRRISQLCQPNAPGLRQLHWSRGTPTMGAAYSSGFSVTCPQNLGTWFMLVVTYPYPEFLFHLPRCPVLGE